MVDGDFLRKHRQQTLDEHINLSRQKAVSYLPIATIEKVLGLTVAAYKQLVERAGNKCVVFDRGETCINSGAVYAYSDSNLEAILQDHAATLSRNNWPISTDEFIKKIATEWFDEDYPTMPVVRRVFGEAIE